MRYSKTDEKGAGIGEDGRYKKGAKLDKSVFEYVQKDLKEARKIYKDGRVVEAQYIADALNKWLKAYGYCVARDEVYIFTIKKL